MRNKIIIIILAVILVTGSAVWFFSRPNSAESDLTNNLDNVSSSAEKVEIDSGNWIIYKNPIGFSFKHPSNFSMRLVTSNTDGDTYLLSSNVVNSKIQIQIFVRPITEKGAVDITEADIKADNPNLKISNSQPIIIGEKSGSGLAFIVGDKGENKFREIWFAYEGQLYQISTFLANDALLKEIMNTWVFKKE